uniref:hypothetical protein n=1 Tax=Sphingomonas elodea TaxID=179878 RepID=UPI00058BEC2E
LESLHPNPSSKEEGLSFVLPLHRFPRLLRHRRELRQRILEPPLALGAAEEPRLLQTTLK